MLKPTTVAGKPVPISDKGAAAGGVDDQIPEVCTFALGPDGPALTTSPTPVLGGAACA